MECKNYVWKSRFAKITRNVPHKLRIEKQDHLKSPVTRRKNYG